MALYLYQVSYTSEAVAALVREPQDRIEAVRPAIEAMGGKLVAAGYPFPLCQTQVRHQGQRLLVELEG
jgi:hypothetical protein